MWRNAGTGDRCRGRDRSERESCRRDAGHHSDRCGRRLVAILYLKPTDADGEGDGAGPTRRRFHAVEDRGGDRGPPCHHLPRHLTRGASPGQRSSAARGGPLE